MIPPESSGASRTKVAWCNLGRTALVLGLSRHFPPRKCRGCRPTGRPATVQVTSAVRRRRVVRLHPVRREACPASARPSPPPTGHDSPPDPRPRRPSPPPSGHDSPPDIPRAVTSRRPDPGQLTVCDHSTPHTRHVPTTHAPEVAPPAARSPPPPVRQFVPPRRDAPGASRDFTPGREARPASAPRPSRPSPPPTGHDSPPVPPRAVTSRRPDPGQPTLRDHSTPHTRHVLTTRRPTRGTS